MYFLLRREFQPIILPLTNPLACIWQMKIDNFCNCKMDRLWFSHTTLFHSDFDIPYTKMLHSHCPTHHALQAYYFFVHNTMAMAPNYDSRSIQMRLMDLKPKHILDNYWHCFQNYVHLRLTIFFL